MQNPSERRFLSVSLFLHDRKEATWILIISRTVSPLVGRDDGSFHSPRIMFIYI
jgi:hypothetical protein